MAVLQVSVIPPVFVRFCLIFAVLLHLAACGGGGGSSGDSSSDAGSDPVAEDGPPSSSGEDDAGQPQEEDRAMEEARSLAPVLASLQTDQGLIGSGRIVDDTIAFIGLGEPGEVIEVYLNGQLAGSSLVPQDGNWMLDYTMIPLAPGVYEVALQSVAPNGTATASIGTFVFVYDPTAPAAPVIRSISDDSATALDAITNDNTLQFFGTGEPGASLELFLDNTLVATTQIDSAGDWQVDFRATPLNDGSYVVSAESVVMTLRSATSAQFPLVIDTVAPAAPAVSGIIPDSGMSATDAVTNVQQLQFIGSAEPYAAVQVQLDGVVIGTVTAGMDGSWQFDHRSATLAENIYAVRAIQTDLAGNVSGLSSPLAVEVDVTSPATVSLLSFDPDTGVAGDGITASGTLIIAGTAPANNWVTVFVDGLPIGTEQADSLGSWQVDHSATLLPDAAYAVTAQVSDAAGNLSAVSPTLAVVVDSVAPAAPVISALLSDTGTLGDLITADPGVILGGSAEANGTVTVFLGAVEIGTVIADGAGDWIFDYSATSLGAGVRFFTAQVEDAAGNLSAVSGAFAITIDVSAPAVPVITGVTDDTGAGGDAITFDTSPTLTGTAESGTTITVYRDSVEIGTAVADVSGNWSVVHAGAPLSDAQYRYSAMATDSAGNSSAVSAEFPVTIDTLAPAIAGLIPADDALDAAYTTNLVLGFDSDVVIGSGNITVRRLTDNSVFEQIPVTDPRISISGGVLVVIDPVANLVGDTAYAVQVDSTAITDVAGNAFAGISDNTSWNFTTEDLLLVSSVPSDNASGVLLDAVIQLNFNSVATIGSGDIRIRRGGDNSLFATIAVTDPLVSGGGGTAITITPPDVFEPNTAYYLEIDPGTFDTVSGASFDGISDPTSLNFVTANFPVPVVTNVTSSVVDGIYRQSDVIDVQVQFSDAVFVTLGTPQLTLDLAGYDATLDLVSGSGTSVLTFQYTVMLGDASPDLDYVAATALVANGARVRSADFVNADLTLPLPGAPGSLGANKAIVVSAQSIDSGNLGDDGTQTAFGIAGARLGWSVAGLGDINGDGYEDYAAGAPGLGNGVVYVFWGKPGATLPVVNLGAFAATDGFRLTGVAAGDNLGESLGGAGDLNGDGYDDIFVMAPGNDTGGTDRGAAYVIWGRAGATRSDVNLATLATDFDTHNSAGFVIRASENSQRLGDAATLFQTNGQAIASGGDFNGDGVHDLVIGHRFSDAGGADSGQAFVIFGKRGATRHAIKLDSLGADGFRISGASAGWLLGQGVRFVGDTNGDGYDDVAIGAIWNDENSFQAGKVYVLLGGPGPLYPDVNVTLLDGFNGYALFTGFAENVLGHSVAAGDSNGDGLVDLLISSNGSDTGGLTENGLANLVYGSNTSAPYADVDVDGLGTGTGYRILGDTSGNFFSHSLDSAGDFDGDGLDDLLIATYLDDESAFDAGAAWLILGANGDARSDVDTATLTSLDGFKILGAVVSDHFAASTSHGDFNGDGYSDLLMGAPLADRGVAESGDAIVILGRDFQLLVSDSLTGDADVNHLVGTDGDDSIVGGGGADTVSTGAGDDRIEVPDLAFQRVNGGRGTDTLVFNSSGNALDLSMLLPEKINGIEVIDLGDQGNSLNVSKTGLLALSTETNRLVVRGGSADVVTVAADEVWLSTGSTVIDGATFNTYIENGAVLYVQDSISQSGISKLASQQQYTFNTTLSANTISAPVTRFPVLIRITNTSILTSVQSGAPDIRFSDADRVTWLDYEIERWTSTAAEVWVLVPQIDRNSNTDHIVLHYNDVVNGSVPDAQNPANVWVDYAGVWHMGEGASGTAFDSTVFGNDAAQVNGTASNVTAIVGNGRQFSANNSMRVNYDASFDAADRSFSVSAWVYEPFEFNPIFHAADTLIARGTSGNHWMLFGYTLVFCAGEISPGFEIQDGSGTSRINLGLGFAPFCINGGNWVHMTASYSRSTGLRLYGNGALESSNSSLRNNMEAGQNLVFGAASNRLDEVRLARRALTADEIKLQYQNQRTGSTLVSPQ